MKKYILLKLFLISCIGLYAQLIGNKVGDIEGMDATYFFKSKNGYWLGTGSSGGIYFTTNLNSHWQAFNNPFGYSHIYWIGQYKNKIVTNADSAYYYFEERTTKWHKIENILEINMIKIVEQTDKINEFSNAKKSLQDLKDVVLPYDINSINQISEDSLIICSQRGIYLYDLMKNKYLKIKTSGVYATDIYQIKKIKDGKIFVLTNDYRILSYENKIWNEIFYLPENLIKHLNFEISLDSAGNPILGNHKLNIPEFFPKGYFTFTDDTSIVYVLKNIVFIINVKTKQTNYFIVDAKKSFNLVYFDKMEKQFIGCSDYYYTQNKKLIYKKYLLDKGIHYLQTDTLPENEIPHFNQDFRFTEFVFPQPELIVKTNLKTHIYKKTSKGLFMGYYLENIKNPKIISVLVDESERQIYLGTSGSGVLKINHLDF